ncbi:hypothetical protein LEMLEM_LOCUS18263 [Lemmus lemmus]
MEPTPVLRRLRERRIVLPGASPIKRDIRSYTVTFGMGLGRGLTEGDERGWWPGGGLTWRRPSRPGADSRGRGRWCEEGGEEGGARGTEEGRQRRSRLRGRRAGRVAERRGGAPEGNGGGAAKERERRERRSKGRGRGKPRPGTEEEPGRESERRASSRGGASLDGAGLAWTGRGLGTPRPPDPALRSEDGRTGLWSGGAAAIGGRGSGFGTVTSRVAATWAIAEERRAQLAAHEVCRVPVRGRPVEDAPGAAGGSPQPPPRPGRPALVLAEEAARAGRPGGGGARAFMPWLSGGRRRRRGQSREAQREPPPPAQLQRDPPAPPVAVPAPSVPSVPLQPWARESAELPLPAGWEEAVSSTSTISRARRHGLTPATGKWANGGCGTGRE